MGSSDCPALIADELMDIKLDRSLIPQTSML
ncbi:hypothetical protein EMIT0P228_10362 [Pseudomonas brassicacearum]